MNSADLYVIAWKPTDRVTGEGPWDTIFASTDVPDLAWARGAIAKHRMEYARITFVLCRMPPTGHSVGNSLTVEQVRDLLVNEDALENHPQ